MIENKPKYRNENPNADENNFKVAGQKVYLGAWAGVDNNEAQIKGITVTFDEPAQPPKWKYCSQILNREFVMFENEKKHATYINGEMCTYTKFLTQEQYINDTPRHTYEPKENIKVSNNDIDEEPLNDMLDYNKGDLTPIKVLTNMVDGNHHSCISDREISNDRFLAQDEKHEKASSKITLATVLGVCGSIALLIVVMSLFM